MIRTLLTVGLTLHVIGLLVAAENWPTFQHDNRRSGVSSETLTLPLTLAWTWESPLPPQTAWTSPAKWDAYSGNEELQSMRNFDPCFYVTAVDDLIFFGSSVDNGAHALDASTGETRWIYHTDSAVRLPPTWYQGNIYFGSDDGYAYALKAQTGELLWRHSPVPDALKIPSNGKLISPWPCRTGILISDGLAHYSASLLPWNSSYLCAIDAITGTPRYVTEDVEVTLQGAMLASNDGLYVPQGRSAPLRYGMKDGKKLGQIDGAGGVFCLITEDEQFVAGPANQKSSDSQIGVIDPISNRSLVSFAGTNRILIRGPMAYVHQGNDLMAVERLKLAACQQEQTEVKLRLSKRGKEIQELSPTGRSGQINELKAAQQKDERRLSDLGQDAAKSYLWRVPHEIPIGFMLAGNLLFSGSDGSVTAVDADSGEERWHTEVEGKAYGLVAAQGRLIVSTDKGYIYVFTNFEQP